MCGVVPESDVAEAKFDPEGATVIDVPAGGYHNGHVLAQALLTLFMTRVASSACPYHWALLWPHCQACWRRQMLAHTGRRVGSLGLHL